VEIFTKLWLFLASKKDYWWSGLWITWRALDSASPAAKGCPKKV